MVYLPIKKWGGEKMRLQFEFEISNIPLQYRLGILSIIKEMIQTGSEEYYQQIFQKNNRDMKPFTYSTYIENLTVNQDEIIGDRLILTVSSPSYEFIMYLMNGSQRSDAYRYKDYRFILKQKRLLPRPPEFTDVVTFKTASPILIENKIGKPVLANDENFEKELNYFADIALKEIQHRHLKEPIHILKTAMKKVVIKEKLHQDVDRDIYITANQGILKLKGHPDDLKFMYDNGIGRRRSLGFGLLNVKEVEYS